MNIKVQGQHGKLENNVTGAKVELVMGALNHVQRVIEVCYGDNPYPGSDFNDEEIAELAKDLNNWWLKLLKREVRDYDIEHKDRSYYGI